jgi:cell division protease FtsH
VGASRVRDLFAQAKKVAPAIIFIDEIDAVGRHRGVGIGSGHDEREQTLNQILVEMDGFEANQKVIIMAATNRPDVLDGALLRPGRFDRQVMLELPDRKDRLEILQIHSRKKKIASDVTLDVVAERTPGFSGADLDSLMNEAAILTARRDKKEIGQLEVLESIEKVMIGPERTSHLHTEKERKLTAYHEAGHAIIASALPNADPVHKVSIVARGHAGGYTLKLPLEDKKMHSKKEFLDDIAMSLGGYVAEQMIFDDVTTGPSNDLQVSTKLARSMVTKWGMSDAIGPVALEGNDGQALFGSGVDKNQHSDRHEQLIDDEVSKIMNNALVVARETLTKYRDALEAVAQKLLETETLEQNQYNEIIAKFGLVGKVSDVKVG